MNLNSTNRKYTRIIIIGGAFVCFAYLAYMVTTCEVLAFDTVIRQWAYGLRNPVLNVFFITITYLGNWQTITAIGLILLLVKQTRRNIGLPFAAVSLSSTLVYKIVKSIFARPRPEFSVRIIEQGGFSFPSGHSMNGLVCFGILIYLIRRYCKNKKTADILTVLLSVLIIAIGCS